jgi:predicted alpha/beta superfamily hydrolase
MPAVSQQSPFVMSSAIIPGASVREVRSKAGRDYRIFVWRPQQVTTGPLPVLYLLDGNVTFPIAAAAAAAQSRRPEITGVQPMIVVGIGYPTAEWLDADRRTFDYTPELTGGALPRRPDDRPWPTTGGADAFLDFLNDELQPAVAREFDTDPARNALFGHSFGGLFALHALFSGKARFERFIAASPSIWFGGESLMAEMQNFIQAPGGGLRHLLVTVGSLEQGTVDDEVLAPTGHDAWLKRNRMVDNARDLVARLAVMNASVLRVGFARFDDENHASVVPAAISRALRFAMAPK